MKTFKGYIAFFALIVLLATVFHHPIRIIDAFTSDPVPGFGIHVSVWRILFEPVLGPLLFYLRADQPLPEYIVLLVWILSIALLVNMYRAIRKNTIIARATKD